MKLNLKRSQIRFHAYSTLAILVAAALIYSSVMAQQVGVGTDYSDKPEVIHAVAPVYPDMIGEYREIETVIVRVEVDQFGKVTSAKYRVGSPLFHSQAEAAARRWLFASTDNPKVRKVVLVFLFHTMPKGTPKEELTPVFHPPYKIEVRHLHGINR
jgi:hypothetical protein